VLAGLPPLRADYPLPPLPDRSPRTANYTIEARLDPEKRTIDGRLVLEWRSLADRPLDTFPFHLYWNAFRNNLSTSMRERGTGARAGEGDRAARVPACHVRACWEAAISLHLRFVNPTTGTDDRTVMESRRGRWHRRPCASRSVDVAHPHSTMG
jgi:hypothetical protein